MSAYETNWAAMGLSHYQPNQNAFASVPPKAPEKPSPAPSRQGHNATPLRGAIKNSAPGFNVPIATQEQSDRTMSIGGRKL